jgi:hypothetical protein
MLVYYCMVLIPIIPLYFISTSNNTSPFISLGLMFFYLLIYKPFIDVMRLITKNIIRKKDWWKVYLNPMQYFRELYFPNTSTQPRF